jgi:hypothetical protein
MFFSNNYKSRNVLPLWNDKARILSRYFIYLLNKKIFDRLTQWSEYSPIAQEVASLIPAQYKHLCAWTCLFVLALGVSMYNMYIFTKKKNISMHINPLSRIHNTSLVSAYFGLDKRECLKYLEYLFYLVEIFGAILWC